MFYRSRKAIAASIPATANPLVPTLVERLGYPSPNSQMS